MAHINSSNLSMDSLTMFKSMHAISMQGPLTTTLFILSSYQPAELLGGTESSSHIWDAVPMPQRWLHQKEVKECWHNLHTSPCHTTLLMENSSNTLPHVHKTPWCLDGELLESRAACLKHDTSSTGQPREPPCSLNHSLSLNPQNVYTRLDVLNSLAFSTNILSANT